MKLICYIEDLSQKRLCLVVSGKMNDQVNDNILKRTDPFKLGKGKQTFISTLGFTWRYDHDAGEIVMVSMNSDMFVLNLT